MKKAIVLYNSKTGTTEKLAGEIRDFLNEKGLESQVASIYSFNSDDLRNVDFVFLGCWTNGLMILLQHPERTWVEFARTLPNLSGKKIGLFTTYTIATGSMFRKMREHVKCNPGDILAELKSRDGHLTESNRKDLQSFLT